MTSPKKEEAEVIYRPYITLKDGRRIYAAQFGKKAFPIKVKPKGTGK
jgi:hypothetical protein